VCYLGVVTLIVVHYIANLPHCELLAYDSPSAPLSQGTTILRLESMSTLASMSLSLAIYSNPNPHLMRQVSCPMKGELNLFISCI
jgi:hypothetical protein